MTTIQHPSLCDRDECMHSADVYLVNEDGETAHKLCACCTVAMTAPMTAQALHKFTLLMREADVPAEVGGLMLFELCSAIAAGAGHLVNDIMAADALDLFDGPDGASTITVGDLTIDAEGVWNV